MEGEHNATDPVEKSDKPVEPIVKGSTFDDVIEVLADIADKPRQFALKILKVIGW